MAENINYNCDDEAAFTNLENISCAIKIKIGLQYVGRVYGTF